MDDSQVMVQWATEGVLASCHRPGFAVVKPSVQQVRQWMDTVLGLGIRSILCILETQHLAHYDHIGLDGGGLLDHYRSCGLGVSHIPARDYKFPPLSKEELARVWESFQSLDKPVLVHCNAGINRTGAAIDHILSMQKQSSSPSF